MLLLAVFGYGVKLQGSKLWHAGEKERERGKDNVVVCYLLVVNFLVHNLSQLPAPWGFWENFRKRFCIFWALFKYCRQRLIKEEVGSYDYQILKILKILIIRQCS